jgi:DNA replication protein DnaC
MTIQTTADQLRDLRLLGFLEAWLTQQSTPTYHDLTFDERFALLVEQEHTRRLNQRLYRRLAQAHLPTSATLDQIDFTVARGLKKSQFLELAQGQWLNAPLHLLLLGPTGIGKSFLAVTLADHLCKLRFSVRYFKTADLLLDIKFAKADGSFPKFRQQLLGFDLLILDEWVRDPVPTLDARDLLDLLDDRYRKRPCLFISQIPVNQWHSQIQDPTLADAILDRIVHDSIRIELKGESMRKLTSPIQQNKHLVHEEN